FRMRRPCFAPALAENGTIAWLERRRTLPIRRCPTRVFDFLDAAPRGARLRAQGRDWWQRHPGSPAAAQRHLRARRRPCPAAGTDGDVIDGVGPILEIGGHAVGRRRGLAVAAPTPQGRDVLALRDKSGLRAVLGDRALALAAGRLAVLAPLAG